LARELFPQALHDFPRVPDAALPWLEQMTAEVLATGCAAPAGLPLAAWRGMAEAVWATGVAAPAGLPLAAWREVTLASGLAARAGPRTAAWRGSA